MNVRPVDDYESHVICSAKCGIMVPLHLTDGQTKIATMILDPSRFTDRFKESMFNTFFPMVLNAYDQDKTYDWFSEAVYHRMFASDALLTVVDGDTTVALSSFDFIEHNGKNLYVGMVAVNPDYKSHGYVKAMIAAMTFDSKHVILRTQNPVMANIMQSIYGTVTPLTDPAWMHEYMDGERELCQIVAEKTGTTKTFNKKTFVCKGIYNRQWLCGAKARCVEKTGRIGDKLLDLINPANGDAIMLVSSVLNGVSLAA